MKNKIIKAWAIKNEYNQLLRRFSSIATRQLLIFKTKREVSSCIKEEKEKVVRVEIKILNEQK